MVTAQPAIFVPKEKVAAFCQKNHIERLGLFGSVTRADFNVDSDVDVLVEFEPDHVPGLAFFALQDELSMCRHRVEQAHHLIMDGAGRGNGAVTANDVGAAPVGNPSAGAFDDGNERHQIPLIEDGVGHNVGAAGGH